MANSKYEYVKTFELSDVLLPHTWIVIRVDGRGFTRFAQVHDFEKPNDEKGLFLMNECAKAVLEDIPDVVFAYGVSDEFRSLYSLTAVGGEYLAAESPNWELSEDGGVRPAVSYCGKVALYINDARGKELQYAPSFDGRAVCYPSDSILRDYLAWRQVDYHEVLLECCREGHINNQYNTCYWNLVKSGCSAAEAQAVIKGTLADFKNELLHTRFHINYNDLPAIFRKGSLVFKRKDEAVVKIENGVPITRARSNVVVVHEDMIKDTFWNENPFILNVGTLKKFKSTPLKERDGRAIPTNLDRNDQT